MSIEIGSTWGRWTVVKHAPPARRYGESGTRARVVVRCVCGTERPVFASDLQSGKTRGCRSHECLWRWRHAGEPRQLSSELRLLTLREAAERLGVAYDSARRWARQGRLQVVRIGRLVRVHEHALESMAPSNLARPSVQERAAAGRSGHPTGHNPHQEGAHG